MRVKTWWGEVEAEYWRDDKGAEGLRVVGDVPAGGYRGLLPRDLSVTGDWDRTLNLALGEAVKKAVEDRKFSYKPPAVAKARK